MPASLKNQFISDLYTSLLHLSGAELGANGPLNQVFDGAGNSTGIGLSGKRVVINNYIYPKGWDRHTRPPMEWLDAFFPIGCLQLTFDDNDPNTRIAGTTWGLVSEGRFLVGVGTYSDKNGDTYSFCPGSPAAGGEDGNDAGEYEHTLEINEIPGHSHLTNVGGTEVLIPSPVGTPGDSIEGTPAGLQDSAGTFADQQQARNELANLIRWNFGNKNGYTGLVAPNMYSPDPAVGYGEYLGPVKYALDLNFLRGSAANYNLDPNPYRDNQNWAFIEMIGIWNGETRFIPMNEAGRRNIPAESSQNGLKGINFYEWLLAKGCVEVGNATVGQIEEQQNKAPLYLGDGAILEQAAGAENNIDSFTTGGGDPHNNIPPSYGVYVWKRLT